MVSALRQTTLRESHAANMHGEASDAARGRAESAFPLVGLDYARKAFAMLEHEVRVLATGTQLVVAEALKLTASNALAVGHSVDSTALSLGSGLLPWRHRAVSAGVVEHIVRSRGVEDVHGARRSPSRSSGNDRRIYARWRRAQSMIREVKSVLLHHASAPDFRGHRAGVAASVAT